MLNPSDTRLLHRALALGGPALVDSIHQEAVTAAESLPELGQGESSERADAYRRTWHRRVAEHEAATKPIPLPRHG